MPRGEGRRGGGTMGSGFGDARSLSRTERRRDRSVLRRSIPRPSCAMPGAGHRHHVAWQAGRRADRLRCRWRLVRVSARDRSAFPAPDRKSAREPSRGPRRWRRGSGRGVMARRYDPTDQAWSAIPGGGTLRCPPFHHPVGCSSRIAALNVSAVSGARWCMPWADLACSAVFFITSSSVAPVATKSHPFIRSLQCRVFMSSSLGPSRGLAERASVAMGWRLGRSRRESSGRRTRWRR